MKFRCNTAELAEACANVSRAACSKTSIPAIEGILIVADGSQLILTGYDLEMGITTSIPSHNDEDGAIVLNAHTLTDILKRLPGDTVVLKSDSRQIAQISSGNSEFQLIGISSEEYPELPSVTNGYPVVIDQELLKDMVRKTIFSCAVKDSKTVHTGIKFEIGSNTLKLIAVDGVRLAMRTEGIAYNGDFLDFVVPAKTLSEVVKLMNDEEGGNVQLGVGKRHIMFELEGYTIISRLLDGEFLNYKGAIPQSCSTTVTVDTRKLLDCIDRTSLIISDKQRSPIKCVFKGNYINISAVTALGSASDSLAANIEGDDCTIGFNNKYMMEALRVCDTDEVKIMLDGAIKPILILPTSGDSFTFLVLPVRLKNEN